MKPRKYKTFRDLKRLSHKEWIDSLPKLHELLCGECYPLEEKKND